MATRSQIRKKHEKGRAKNSSSGGFQGMGKCHGQVLVAGGEEKEEKEEEEEETKENNERKKSGITTIFFASLKFVKA